MAEDESRKSPETSSDLPAELAELESISSQAAYDAFLVPARAIDPSILEECCADLALTYQNVTRGVEGVLGSGAVLVGKLPNVDVVELSLLPRLVQGVAFAALQVQRELRAASFGPLFDQAQNMRRKLRKTADALAEANLLADADADEVRLYGQQDVIADCLALAAIFRRNEARISGRSPLTPAEVRDAEQIAEKLKVLLGQASTGEGGGAPLVRFIEMRDRFWTLLTQRHDVLWRCGAWLYGRGVDDRVPPLVIRQPVVRKPRSTASERESSRTVTEPRRTMGPPAITPSRVSPPAPVVRDSTRHLSDLQRELERKTRFLVRIGAIPDSR